ncbi:hypothetical protein NX875_11210, partial [Burkholderia thailandensis]|nr:hypothetical protein [Burkholderia thailandensis]
QPRASGEPNAPLNYRSPTQNALPPIRSTPTPTHSAQPAPQPAASARQHARTFDISAQRETSNAIRAYTRTVSFPRVPRCPIPIATTISPA